VLEEGEGGGEVANKEVGVSCCVKWFPVDVSCIAFICYSVGVCIYKYVGDCVCGERNSSSSSSCVVVVGR
jgi:hypothetical protein